MRRVTRSVANIGDWIESHNVSLYGVNIQSTGWGSGIVVHTTIDTQTGPLIEVPAKLVLSQQYVWQQAELDSHLKEALVALGEFAQTARGAITFYLLFQISAASPDLVSKIGTESPWTTYVQFLSGELHLPTFWTDAEQKYCQGTTLEPALEAKLRSLRREFETLTEQLSTVPWCKEAWFDRAILNFSDWQLVDSLYRSRGMELPHHGLCMVPIADMVNHGQGSRINARSNVDEATGNFKLVSDRHECIEAGQEMFITYGDEKGACEMLFSYGFINNDMTQAESVFLNLDPPDDDPLFLAKQVAFPCAPGVRISNLIDSNDIKWYGAYVWLQCVNEEDGLEFALEERHDKSTKKHLIASWRGKPLQDADDLEESIRADPLYDLFKLRAITIIRGRIEQELDRRRTLWSTETCEQQDWWLQRNEASLAWQQSRKLMALETTLLQKAVEYFKSAADWLIAESETVKRYFGGSDDPQDVPDEQS